MSNYNTKQHTCIECGRNFTGRKKKYCSKECSDEVRRRKNRERMRKVNPPKPNVTIICEWCGELHTVPARTAHQARFCSDDCRYTYRSRVVNGHKPIEKHNAERREQKLKRQAKLERERLERTVTKTCEWCKGEFKTTEAQRVTCSSECSRKRLRRIEHLRRDKRINETNLVDRDITLERLFERDKGICYICNAPCDFDDKTITDEGYFIAGKTYPSIDHVYPLARGGKHSWDNVRLAHHGCNSEKSDELLKEMEPLPNGIAYSLAKEISPRSKATIQYTLDGKEVNRFNSTVEAEKETGFKAKGIQKCARKEVKTYKGYIWRYA